MLRLVLSLAASVALFAAGMVAGRRAAPRASQSAASHARATERFVLFLLDEPPGGEAEEPARVAEYKRWAASLGGGRLVAGEKLGDASRLLLPDGLRSDGLRPNGESTGEPSERSLRGYFVIEAPSLARAVEVARTCPHLKRGGRILVRPIVPV